MNKLIILIGAAILFSCSSTKDAANPVVANASLAYLDPTKDTLVFTADLSDDYSLKYFDISIRLDSTTLTDTIHKKYTPYEIELSKSLGGTKTQIYQRFIFNDSTLSGVYNFKFSVRDWQGKSAGDIIDVFEIQ